MCYLWYLEECHKTTLNFCNQCFRKNKKKERKKKQNKTKPKQSKQGQQYTLAATHINCRPSIHCVYMVDQVLNVLITFS